MPTRAEEPFDAVLAAAKAGQPWAFEILFERAAGRLAAFLRARGAADPDGLTNEVLLRAFRGIGRFEGAESGFIAWVFTIARNALVDERRSRGRRVDPDPVDPNELPDLSSEDPDLAESQVREERVRGILDGLSDDQREIVLLRVLAGLSVEETAEAVGKTPGAVKALQHRALRRLHKRLSAGP